MNRENLKKLADFIKTVPQEIFDMRDIRRGRTDNAECDSVGCVIGHATVLYEGELPRYSDSGSIDFSAFWNRFGELPFIDSSWIVCSSWKYVDNTPLGASKRIEWLLKHGLPKNWENQMNGKAPLCYN